MGNKKTKPSTQPPGPDQTASIPIKPVVLPPKSPELSESDYEFLINQTGSSRAELKKIFDKFNANNPDGKLDKKEFVRLYDELRPEPPELLDEISEFVFKAFDTDHNGTLSFQEFMVAYALTSRGDLKKKLEYAFALYDLDGNGFLDTNEIRSVLYGMLDLLGADRKHNNVQHLAEECMKDLDASKDGKCSKDEFINGLMKNYSLRSLMSPFN